MEKKYTTFAPSLWAEAMLRATRGLLAGRQIVATAATQKTGQSKQYCKSRSGCFALIEWNNGRPDIWRYRDTTTDPMITMDFPIEQWIDVYEMARHFDLAEIVEANRCKL